MITNSLKLGIRNMSDIQFVPFAQNILTNLKENEVFKPLEKKVKATEAVFNDFMTYYSIPKNQRSQNTRVAKNEHKAKAIQAIINLGQHVEALAEGNATILEYSGYELRKTPTKKGELKAITNVQFRTNGERGLLKVICPPNKNASLFEAQIFLDGNNTSKPDLTGASHNRTILVKDCPVGVRLRVEVRMSNPHGDSPWSNTYVARIPEHEDVIHVEQE